MVEIEEVSEDVGEFERIGSHSHITGLGLTKEGNAKDSGDGLVGQKRAREAAGHVVNLAKKGNLAGRGVLLAGPPGTGKTAIAVGISEELGKDIPFVQLAGSEIFSADKDKTEVLKEKLRRALGVTIEETREVYEGKVEQVELERGQAGMNPMQQTPAGASLTLKTEDDERTLRLGRRVAASIQKQGIREGDVVRIDSDSGKLRKLGKAQEDWKEGKDVSADEPVPVPAGDVQKEREFTHTLTLHHMDLANANRGGGGLLSVFGMGKSGITEDIRDAVDKQVKEMIDKGKAELVPGVLFIDEVHMLDIEAISFLNRAMEREFAPIMVLASNRGQSKIRGTDLESPYGLPLDLLDRLLITNTEPYDEEEVREILKIRSAEEEAKLTEEALEKLTEIGAEASMRYAVQLMAPARDIMELSGDEEIDEEHVEEARKRFLDVESSSDRLQKYEDRMLS